MRAIRLVVPILGSALGLGLCPALSAEPASDSLWARAVALWGANDDLVPGLIEMRMQEVDKEGRAKHEGEFQEIRSALSLGEDGEIRYETLRVVENGEDVTALEKARADERKEKGGGDDSGSHEVERYSPFDPSSQAGVSERALGGGGIVGGRNTMLYEFTETGEDGRKVMGKAWLDAGSGSPVVIEYTLDPLPSRVKRMTTRLEYEQAASDSLVVRRMVMDVSGGFLFFKKHYHMDMEFDDYWRLPEDK
jgi:hypothetical protein